jgi:hypothetical protein
MASEVVLIWLAAILIRAWIHFDDPVSAVNSKGFSLFVDSILLASAGAVGLSTAMYLRVRKK